jgi:hypothetical protein
MYTKESIMSNVVSPKSSRMSRSERGEGVVSVALAVLIMAGLAGLMWVAYKGLIEDTNTQTKTLVNDLGK